MLGLSLSLCDSTDETGVRQREKHLPGTTDSASFQAFPRMR